MNISNLTGFNENLGETCWGGSKYSIECLSRMLCGSITKWTITAGIIIIISYIIIGWLKWWFFKYGYKKLENKKYEFLGNFYFEETRIYWDMWINARLSKVMLFYIVIVIWLHI